jgi:hypothetical protein
MKKTEAERQISEILQKLEQESGCYVRDIGIARFDVTEMGDGRDRYMKRVSIDLIHETWE